MLKIRLTRKGKKNKAFFRLVVAEHTSPVNGRFIETLGFLNPHTKEKVFKEDRIKYWIEKGAQCSDSVHNLLVASGLVKGPKRAVKMRKKEQLAEEKPEEKKTEGKAEESKPAEEKVEEAKLEPEKTEEKPEKTKGVQEKPAEESPKEEKKEEPARNASPSDAGGEKKTDEKQ